MYTVVVVDDERWALNGMLATIKFQENGFKVICATTDPSTALEVITKEKPDVVFTDVRMPGISGITLLNYCRENSIDSEFVIVSGFSDYEYMREALHGNAVDYCLKPIKEEQVDAILLRLKVRLLDKKNKNTSSPALFEQTPSETLNQLLLYISSNIDKKMYLSELAEHFHYNPNYLGTLFKTHLNTTFSEYINSMKMKRACDLLESTTIPVIQIANSIGFDDVHYFLRTFKKHLGMTPKEYRKEFRKRSKIV